MKITKRENYRVIVEPRNPGNFGFARVGGIKQSEKEWERDCDDLIRQIKRHVDGKENVYMEYDTASYCEYCGSEWTEASPTYNGGCCQKDEEKNPEDQAS